MNILVFNNYYSLSSFSLNLTDIELFKYMESLNLSSLSSSEFIIEFLCTWLPTTLKLSLKLEPYDDEWMIWFDTECLFIGCVTVDSIEFNIEINKLCMEKWKFYSETI